LEFAGGGITLTDRCSKGTTGGKEKLMTERERRAGSGGTEDNVRDELDEATKRDNPEESATREAVEEEERTGGPGGVKDNVRDEGEESQRR
jgi:hypothetical protein